MRKLKYYGKLTAIALAAMLMINLFGTVPSVSAESAKLYTHNGYMIEYAVMSEWAGNQNIQITLTNTGAETIYNWALGYDAGGAINGLWNAVVYGQQENGYILKNAGHNSEIKSEASVVFGYNLGGEDFKFPEDITICSKRVDITEGVDIYYNMDSDYGYSFLASVTIANNSDTPIEAWQLSFDTGAAIYSVWNATLISGENGHFVVGNDWNTSVINARSSVTFNINGGKENGAGLLMENFALNGVIIPLEFDFGGGGEDEEEIVLTAGTYYDIESGLVSVNWESTEPSGIFEVMVSYDEENFSVVGTAENSNTYSFTPDEFELLYIKVKQTSGERTAESEVCFVVNTAEEIDWDDLTDTDEDDLPDVYEKYIYKTDPENSDTDSDGLPDGYEALYLETDPAATDTDENGVSDGDEDFDGDDLTNYEEYTSETNPFSADTDGDGLSDYEEIYTYSTDPLNYDTDGDIVSDGDEIELSLDPNNSQTHGYPDGEYTVSQEVAADDDSFAVINNDEANPFDVSLEIKSAGVAANNIIADKSGYSSQILRNEAVIGLVPEFTYVEGLSIDDVIISFNLESAAAPKTLRALSNEEALRGINKYNIFKLFEDTNALLPIETFYDEANNRVYAHVDELGTYCLVDMEQWVNYIENLPAGNYYENGEDTDEKVANSPANIVFCLDTREVNVNLDEAKENVREISEWALETYSDVNIYVYTQTNTESYRVQHALIRAEVGGETRDYFRTVEGVQKAVDYVATITGGSKMDMYDFTDATQFMIDKCDGDDSERLTMIYHIVAGEEVRGEVKRSQALSDVIRDNVGKIYVSAICALDEDDIGDLSFGKWICEYSGGFIYADGRSSVPIEGFSVALSNGSVKMLADKSGYPDAIRSSISNTLGSEKDKQEFKIVSSTGLVQDVKLSSPLTKPKPEQAGKSADTEGDSLSDWEEVNTDFIFKMLARRKNYDVNAVNDIEEISSALLPTLREFIYNYESKYYIYSVRSTLEEKYRVDLDDLRILPVLSDPTDADSDNDGIPDSIDINRLKIGNNNDIDGGYEGGNNRNNVFVAFPLESGSGNEVKLSGSAELLLLPNEDSKSMGTINAAANTYYEVTAVVLTSESSWIKIRHNDISSYVKGDKVILDLSKKINPLLKIVFGSDSIINGLKYVNFENINITIEANSYAITKNELGFLYAMSDEISKVSGIEDLFSWMLAIGLQESQLGTYKPALETLWDENSNKFRAVGYFECTDKAEDQVGDNMLDPNLNIDTKWSDWAIRLDRQQITYTSEKFSKSIVKFSRKCHYGNVVCSVEVIRYALNNSKQDLGNDANFDDVMYRALLMYNNGVRAVRTGNYSTVPAGRYQNIFSQIRDYIREIL